MNYSIGIVDIMSVYTFPSLKVHLNNLQMLIQTV